MLTIVYTQGANWIFFEKSWQDMILANGGFYILPNYLLNEISQSTTKTIW